MNLITGRPEKMPRRLSKTNTVDHEKDRKRLAQCNGKYGKTGRNLSKKPLKTQPGGL
jgi:hypothetical protein